MLDEWGGRERSMKKQAMKFLANSLVLAGLLTVNVSQAGTDEEVAAIAAVRDAELATVNEGNAANVANVYAADVEFMPPDEPTLSGADAVAAWHAAVFAEYDLDLQYTAADVKVFGDWAVEQYAGNVVITPKA
ncbi:MAG: DUF4440 domain-containing protein, partial [Xanthomonadales bacterium]|nr:DUF4440 domain-containing protein [Xanthomonadales bacterium]NIN59030.1 DUF4440 domain-containing protein [Xanthomonadales bacterium]NIN75016.1 DUF4440 domain-containing protein [Xanthomonadales bacterium]NIO14796.1 DUF4440 domain-containing protein [Xanthomonadales bacterium]NIP11423.1 DUF4440 domain-containing protein [Xanthomonadales bacterium]